MLLNRFRAGIDRFFDVLDSEGVGIFQAVVYLHMVGGGLYLWFGANGDVPDPIWDSLGHTLNTVWLWMCLGPAISLLGKVLCWHPPTKYAGMWLQLSGDLFGFGVFLTYVVATYYASWWGQAVWAVWIMMALAECVAMLIIRDVRRIGQVEQIKHREARQARRARRERR